MYRHPSFFSALERAWAFWVLIHQSLNAQLHASYFLNKTAQPHALSFQRKTLALTTAFSERLQAVQMEACDALEMLARHDGADSFFYIDPPYIDAGQGHKGYTRTHDEALLAACGALKGKFMLSAYESEPLAEAVARYGWRQLRCMKRVKSFNTNKVKQVVNVFSYNYAPSAWGLQTLSMEASWPCFLIFETWVKKVINQIFGANAF